MILSSVRGVQFNAFFLISFRSGMAIPSGTKERMAILRAADLAEALVTFSAG